MNSDLSNLLRYPHLPRVWAARIEGRHRTTGELQRVFLTDAPQLITEPTDDPSSTPFVSRLAGGWSVVRAIGQRGQLGGASQPDYGELFLDNQDGALDYLRDVDLDGQPVQIYLGGLFRTDGAPYPWSSFEQRFAGHVHRFVPTGKKFQIQLRGPEGLDDRPAIETVLEGWGGGLRFGAGQEGVAAHHAGLDVTGALTLGWVGVVHALPSSWAGLVRQGTSAADAVVFVQVGADGTWRLRVRGGSVATNGPMNPGQLVALGAIVDADASSSTGYRARLFQRQAGRWLQVAEGEIPEPQPNGEGVYLAKGGQDIDATYLETWLQTGALEEADLRRRLSAPIEDADEISAMIWAYKFEDRTGDTALDELELADATLTGSPTWSPSLTGDDPTRFGTGAAPGLAEPATVGPCRNVPLVAVDTPGRWHRFGLMDPDAIEGLGGDVVRVRSNGSPMVPPFLATSTEIKFDLAGRSMFGPSGFFAPLIPGQAEPLRPGQQVEISTDSGLNDGVYTLAAEGVRKNGKRLVVVEALQGDEPKGQEVTVRSIDPGYAVDETRSAITLDGYTPAGEEGRLTADVVGWVSSSAEARVTGARSPVGQASASVQYAYWSGRPVDASALEWDPVLGIHSPGGQSPPRRDILARILDSCAAWALLEPDGTVRLGHHAPPSGNPVLELRSLAKEPEGLATVPPHWAYRLAYDRNWTPMDEGSLVQSLTAGDRQALVEPYRWLDDRDQDLRDDYPNATELERETYLTTRADSEELLKRLQALHGRRQRWLQFVAGPEAHALDVAQEVRAFWPGQGLHDGVGFRVTWVDLDPTRDQVIFQGWTHA
ncbi:MAG: hypothetical protein AAGN66_16210 [Acidobacteriota bacterium]